jgi:gas vesicle structural protein
VAVATSGGYLERPRPSGLADVIDVILDKGLVIDAYVRVSLIGIEILTIDARIVIASVDTYLRFAEAVGRLNIAENDDSQGLPELMQSVTEGGSKSKAKGALEGAKEKLSGSDQNGDDGKERSKSQARRRSSSSSSSGGSSRSRKTSG